MGTCPSTMSEIAEAMEDFRKLCCGFFKDYNFLVFQLKLLFISGLYNFNAWTRSLVGFLIHFKYGH